MILGNILQIYCSFYIIDDKNYLIVRDMNNLEKRREVKIFFNINKNGAHFIKYAVIIVKSSIKYSF